MQTICITMKCRLKFINWPKHAKIFRADTSSKPYLTSEIFLQIFYRYSIYCYETHVQVKKKLANYWTWFTTGLTHLHFQINFSMWQGIIPLIVVTPVHTPGPRIFSLTAKVGGACSNPINIFSWTKASWKIEQSMNQAWTVEIQTASNHIITYFLFVCCFYWLEIYRTKLN